MTDARVTGTYLEVLGGAPSSARVSGTYLEVLGGAPSQARVGGTYMEVLFKGEPFALEQSASQASSKLKDFSGTERSLYRWNGTSLVPVKFMLAGSGSGQSYSSLIQADGALGYWTLDDIDRSTAFQDFSGNSHHATIFGSPSFRQDPPSTKLGRKAIQFNGTTYGYIPTPNAWFKNLVELSVEGFFKTTFVSGSVAQTIIAVDNVDGAPGDSTRKFGLNVSGAGKPYFMSYTTAAGAPYAVAPNSYNDGLWHHVVGTRTASTIYLYVDGVLVASQAVGGTLYGLDNSDLTIGASRGVAGSYKYPFNGMLDEISIYGTTLTQAQVTSHYNAAMAA